MRRGLFPEIIKNKIQLNNISVHSTYKINIIDDIDYLIQSEFFVKQQNVLFKVEDYSHLITNNDPKPLQHLKISSSLKSVASITSIDDSIFENIFEKSVDFENSRWT